MKIKVNKEKCAGHARCAAVAPEIYTLDDDGYISFSEAEISNDLKDKAIRGARACPERIIIVEKE